ncbi:MAG TPA: response regulator transcription factor [Sunxiuqinia sp.]|nr:response regulator transcription factor [Sunxiuqinia sp.]
MNQISVLLADDHEIVRDGLKAFLEDESNITIVGEAANGQEALEKAKELQPNVVIMDIRMPEMTGIEATKLMPQYAPDAKILVLTMHETEEYVLRSIESGAHGYLLKDTSKEEFMKAIVTVAKGEKYFSHHASNVLVNQYLTNQQKPKNKADELKFELTKREREILSLITQGLSNKDIAAQLEKSVRTIETHRFNIMKKLDVSNVVELIRVAQEEHLV